MMARRGPVGDTITRERHIPVRVKGRLSGAPLQTDITGISAGAENSTAFRHVVPE